MEHLMIAQNICLTAAILACTGGLALLKGMLKELSGRLSQKAAS